MLKSFGADPELMLMDLDGHYVSAIDIIPGTKKDKVNLGMTIMHFMIMYW
jgi:hypothetical protein